MNPKEQVLTEFIQEGGALLASVPYLGGMRSMEVTAAQAARLIEDKEALFGELLGLSKPEYVEWFHSQGAVFCSSATKSGSPCRNYIVGATSLQPSAWQKQRHEGGYCAVHGGLAG